LRAAQLLGAGLAGGLTAGCVWVTDIAAKGYTVREGGAESPSCASVHDCDAGAVCCVVSMGAHIMTACLASCPTLKGMTPLQICASDAECAGGTCVEQACAGTNLSVCGPVPECADASAPVDSSIPVTDASTAAD